jgi:radical SAM superfamily enzyme YgiQ (UPF0313 family)
MTKGKQYVLTADRSLMSHYRDNMLFGFIVCFPAENVPPFMFKQVFCPAVPADKNTGEADAAPLGLRRIEAGLMQASSAHGRFDRSDIIIAHSDHIDKSIGQDTKIVGLNVMDPLGVGPFPSATTQGQVVTINRVIFRDLCMKVKNLKEKHGFKVVVGGSGAWQLSFDKNIREEYSIDHLVIGEADDKIAEIYQDIMAGNAQEIIFTRTNTIKDIPYIQGPTTNGLIEAMRGCGRGCDFCDPNLRMKRDFPIDRLRKEAMINLKHGITSVWLQSDEILLYGCDNSELRPNKDAVINLFREMKSLPNVNYVGAVHLTFSSAMAEPECIRQMSQINNFGPDRWNGVQIGLETASARLIKKHMPYKVKPFSPQEWPWIVRDGLKLLNDNYYFVANTIVIGLPGEDDDDVRETIELLRSLDGTACVVAPMLYTDYHNPDKTVTAKKLSKLQWELYFRCWYLNAKTVSSWVWYGTAHFNPIVRTVAFAFTKLGLWYALRLIRRDAKRYAGVELM